MPDKANPPVPQHPFIPQLTLDCIILGFHEDQLRVLLLRWKGTQEWSLPGGPVFRDESVDAAAVQQRRQRRAYI